MKELLKNIPGINSDKTWVRRTSIVLYAIFLLLSILAGPSFFFIIGGMILIGLAIGKLVKNRKRALKVSAILLTFAIVFIGLGAMFEDASTAQEITPEIQAIIDQNDDLKSEVKELKGGLDSLQTEFEELKEENEDLKQQNEDLEKENEDLKEENEELNEKLEAREEEEEKRLAKEEAEKQEEARKQEEAKKQEQQKAASSSSSSSNTASSSSSSPSNQASAPAEQSQEVLITPTGSKYHARKCGNGNYSPTTLSNAKARGLTPCKKCF